MVPVGLQKEGPATISATDGPFSSGFSMGTVARTPTVPIEGATLVREGARLPARTFLVGIPRVHTL
eukprot:2769372-Prymnesium_polylepis.1